MCSTAGMQWLWRRRVLRQTALKSPGGAHAGRAEGGTQGSSAGLHLCCQSPAADQQQASDAATRLVVRRGLARNCGGRQSNSLQIPSGRNRNCARIGSCRHEGHRSVGAAAQRLGVPGGRPGGGRGAGGGVDEPIGLWPYTSQPRRHCRRRRRRSCLHNPPLIFLRSSPVSSAASCAPSCRRWRRGWRRLRPAAAAAPRRRAA